LDQKRRPVADDRLSIHPDGQLSPVGPVHGRLSINTLSLAPAPLAEQVDTICQVGAAGVSPDLEQILETGVPSAGRMLRQSDLTVATLTHRAFGFATRDDIAQARARLMRTLDIAAAIGARSVIMTTGGRGDLTWSEAAQRFAEAVAPCVEAASAAGIPIGIEPTSHLYADASIAHRLSDTVEIARTANLAVMIDLFGCWFDADIDDALAAAAPISPVVQVSDYVAGDRALPCRAVPGDGMVPWPRLVSILLANGFDGWFDFEIIGPRLQAEGQEAGLRRAAAYMTDLINSDGRLGHDER
jgi:sugar phosphate isomerase/epimerase